MEGGMNMERFNDDKMLWQKARVQFAGYPMGGPRLTVHAGTVSDGYRVLAQFKSQGSAVSVLTRAGFCRQPDGTFKAAQIIRKALQIDELGAAWDRAAGTV
jgi:hypothetical protein